MISLGQLFPNFLKFLCNVTKKQTFEIAAEVQYRFLINKFKIHALFNTLKCVY